MRRFNPFRSKSHHFTPAAGTTTSKTRLKTTTNTVLSTSPTRPITISAPIVNSASPNVNNDRSDQTSTVENQPILDSDNDEEDQVTASETVSDDQPLTPLNRSTISSSSSPKSTSSESTNSVMVGTNNGGNGKEEILTSCKATAMIYNDGQKKWIHCAPNGPAKIQLLFCSETQTYRIVGRQLQDHEVVLNHSISKGIKYNQATPTFHQWRDQSCVYGLNFASKLDAQEFGTTMSKILEFVNGTNPSQTITNGGATLPVAAINNNNNNNGNNNSSSSSNGTMYKRQSSQPPSSHPPPPSSSSIGTTVPISSSSSLEQQQQQQHSSSHYASHSRQNSNSLSSTPAANTTYYSHQHQAPEEDETNYALISDSYSYYGDSATTGKNSNIPQAPPLTSSMSSAASAPQAAPPGPPPPPPPPPLPNGFGSGPPPAPALVLPTGNGAGNGAARKTNTTTSSAPPMDLMSEMAAKFAQRRKQIDDSDKNDPANSANKSGSSTSAKLAATLPPTAVAVPTSPRVGRKSSESHYTSPDLDKLKADILAEIRKDIEKAKQEILAAIHDHQQYPTKK